MTDVADRLIDAARAYSRREVAALLGITTRTLDRWIASREFPSPTIIGGKSYWLGKTILRKLGQ